MGTLRAGHPAAVLALVLLLCACAQRGGDAGAPRTPAPSGAPPATGLVLRVEHVGGFVTPEMLATRLPLVSVFADGRIVTEGPQIAIYPGPALPNVLVWQVDEAAVATLVDQALAAGVAETSDLGSPPVADVPATRFTLVTDAGTYVREVYALFEMPPPEDRGGTDPGDGLTEEQRAARAELRSLLDGLTDPSGPLGAAPGTQPEPYVPASVAAVVRPWTDPEPELAQPEAAWPGPPLPGEPLEPMLDLSCVLATGDAAPAVLAAAATANTLTPWVAADGTRWSLTFRPLLPDETGCPDLRG